MEKVNLGYSANEYPDTNQKFMFESYDHQNRKLVFNDCDEGLSSMTGMTITSMRTPPKITASNQKGPPST